MDFNVILGFFRTYGWQLGLLALSGIVVLGTLKWFGCFKKVNDKIKKYLYFGLSVAFSIIACSTYIFAINAFDWASYGVLCGAVVAVTLVAYGIWENTGLRALWKKVILDSISKLVKLIASAIVGGTIKSDSKVVHKQIVALGADTLNQLVAEARTIEEQKKKAEEEKVNQ